VSFAENRKILNDLKKFDAKIPQMVSEMGSTAQNHFIKSFSNQGFTDEVLQKWKPRKKERYRTRGGKLVDDTSRGILIGKGSGQLRRSLRRVSLGRYGVMIKSDLPYSRIHNEGLMGKAWGKYPFKMPQRQFVGYSRIMNRDIETKIKRIINTVYKSE
jgi:phage gpG-like protein